MTNKILNYINIIKNQIIKIQGTYTFLLIKNNYKQFKLILSPWMKKSKIFILIYWKEIFLYSIVFIWSSISVWVIYYEYIDPTKHLETSLNASTAIQHLSEVPEHHATLSQLNLVDDVKDYYIFNGVRLPLVQNRELMRNWPLSNSSVIWKKSLSNPDYWHLVQIQYLRFSHEERVNQIINSLPREDREALFRSFDTYRV